MNPSRRVALAIVAILVLATYARPAPKAPKPKTDKPARLGLVEEAGIELTLIDVEVTDKDGRPVRGLTKKDFSVYLNGKEWSVYSVDEMCDCEESQPVQMVTESNPGSYGSPVPMERSAAPAARVSPARFVLYLDFSRLQPDGRALAVSESRRWVRESLKRGDEASIVSYATDGGLKEWSPFTSDRRKLAEALDATLTDPKQFDADAAFLPHRMCECGTYGGACEPDPARCSTYAVDEYFRTRRSLQAFRTFLETLGDTPGKKTVLYFNESGVLQPGALFHQDDMKGGDHTMLMDELASVAVASRATIYPVFTGDGLAAGATLLTGVAVNFGANLADATGGRYNRGLMDLKGLLDTAARAGCCTYRVGLQPPAGHTRSVYQVRVEAGGRKVGWLYRIRFEDAMERWMKSARAVLRNPGRSRDLPIGAALVPARSAKGRWTLSVQVALDTNAMLSLPTAEGRAAQWQVGALVSREKDDATWEMLGVSSMLRKDTAGTAAAVVHRKDLDDLSPGTYRLAAFVRDENTSLFGGAESVIELPATASDGIAGPVLLRSPRKFFMAALPAMAGKETKSSSVSEIREATLPPRSTEPTTGEMFEVDTWVCPGEAGASGVAPIRFVTKDGTPVFRFDPVEPRAAGGCLLYADAVDALHLAPGAYSYHFRWNAPGRPEPREGEVKFEVAPAAKPGV